MDSNVKWKVIATRREELQCGLREREARVTKTIV